MRQARGGNLLSGDAGGSGFPDGERERGEGEKIGGSHPPIHWEEALYERILETTSNRRAGERNGVAERRGYRTSLRAWFS